MANILPMEKQIRIIGALAEGNSIRSIERQTMTNRLYAWGYKESDDGPQMKAATVLAVHPINTPQKAVQAFIASQYREQANDAN